MCAVPPAESPSSLAINQIDELPTFSAPRMAAADYPLGSDTPWLFRGRLGSDRANRSGRRERGVQSKGGALGSQGVLHRFLSFFAHSNRLFALATRC